MELVRQYCDFLRDILAAGEGRGGGSSRAAAHQAGCKRVTIQVYIYQYRFDRKSIWLTSHLCTFKYIRYLYIYIFQIARGIVHVYLILSVSIYLLFYPSINLSLLFYLIAWIYGKVYSVGKMIKHSSFYFVKF